VFVFIVKMDTVVKEAFKFLKQHSKTIITVRTSKRMCCALMLFSVSVCALQGPFFITRSVLLGTFVTTGLLAGGAWEAHEQLQEKEQDNKKLREKVQKLKHSQVSIIEPKNS